MGRLLWGAHPFFVVSFLFHFCFMVVASTAFTTAVGTTLHGFDLAGELDQHGDLFFVSRCHFEKFLSVALPENFRR